MDHNNVSGYDLLVDGFGAIDIRDVNYTILYMRRYMNTTDSSITPRDYQSRIVKIIGEIENGGVEIDNTPSIILGIFLILVASGLIYGVSRRR